MRRHPSPPTASACRRYLVRGLSPLLVALLAGACATTSAGDRYFDKGDYASAAAAYEKHLELGDLPNPQPARVLYRLAMIYATAEGPLRDPIKARTLLQHLLNDHSDSPYRLPAQLFLDLERSLAQLQEDVMREEERIDSLTRELAALRSEPNEPVLEASPDKARIQELTRQVRRLQKVVVRLTAEVAEREAELQGIKEIDLNKPP
ncbi:MAG: hypothetical protein WBG67_19270 [Thermoanaerobaculia bacterium]